MLLRLDKDMLNTYSIRNLNMSFSGNKKIFQPKFQNTKEFDLFDINHNKSLIKYIKINPEIQFRGNSSFWTNKDKSLTKRFDAIEEDDRALLTSICFRRGPGVSSSEDFQDIVDSIHDLLKGRKEPIKMLVNGVARGQEPTSLLAVVSDDQKGKPIKDVLDLNLLDINPYPEPFYRISSVPAYGKSSFEELQDGSWQLKLELMKYLEEVYRNCSRPKIQMEQVNLKAKSYWNKDVESFSKQCPPEMYDVITFNNVRGYMADNSVFETLGNFVKMLKVGGILIKDPDTFDELSTNIGKGYVKVSGYEKMKKLKPGIWQKVKDK